MSIHHQTVVEDQFVGQSEWWLARQSTTDLATLPWQGEEVRGGEKRRKENETKRNGGERRGDPIKSVK